MSNRTNEKQVIQAAANVLRNAGYTSDDSAEKIDLETAGEAVAEILVHADSGWFWEHIVEAGIRYGEDRLRRAMVAMLRDHDDRYASSVGGVMLDNASSYASDTLQKALDTLPSAASIQRGRHIDQQIDERIAATG